MLQSLPRMKTAPEIHRKTWRIWIPKKGCVGIPPFLPFPVELGDCVLLKGRNRYHLGIALGEEESRTSPFSTSGFRVISRVPYLSRDLVELILWLESFTGFRLESFLDDLLPKTFPFVLETLILPGFTENRRGRSPRIGDPVILRLPEEPTYYVGKLEGLPEVTSKEISVETIRHLKPAIKRAIRRAIERGELFPSSALPWKPPRRIALTNEQSEAIEIFYKGFMEGKKNKGLLFGVTGSGKTEVYIELTRRILAVGKTALILAPEIALTPGLKERFETGLGVPVEVWHSALPQKVRLNLLRRILRREVPVIIGAKSALFLPLQDLGIIIVDEEHDTGHTLELRRIRISVRDLALKRGELAQAFVLMGSATPSLGVWVRARGGEIIFATLTRRPRGNQKRELRMVDLNNPEERGPYPWLSQTLKEEIEKALGREEAVILFRNRRGYHPLAECPACDQISFCLNCALPLTYHRNPPQLRCHLCGASYPPHRCPSCGTGPLKLLGTGTQRIEQELEELFPDAGILRLDRDILTSHRRLEEILQAFGSGKKRILVGTQMVTKGLDFEHVSCIGILDADGHLGDPDFRTSERLFQRIAQVSGRAGRGSKPGTIVIQTRHPRNPLFLQAVREEVESFYNELLKERRRYAYPPYSRLLRILWETRDELELNRYFQEFRKITIPEGFRLLGPAPAPIPYARKRLRFHALLFAPSWSAIRSWLKFLHALPLPRGTTFTLEFDPPSLM